MEEFIASKIAMLLESHIGEIKEFHEWVVFGIALIFMIIPKIKVLEKLPYWKERKIAEYVIVDKLEDAPLKCHLARSGVFLFESMWVYISLIILLCNMYLFLLFAGIYDAESIAAYGTMGSLLVVTTIGALARRFPSSIRKTIGIFIVILFLDTFGILCGANSVADAASAMLWMGIVSSVGTLLVIICLHRCTNIYIEYTCRVLNISKLLRYVLLPGTCVLCSWRNDWNIVKYVLGISFALTGFEYFFICFKSNKYVIDVTLQLKACEKITRNYVLQYKDNKVRYITVDGAKEIINQHDIRKITYKCKIKQNCWRVKKTECMCTFSDGEIKYYDRCKYKNDKWIALAKDIEGYTYVEIYHSSLIDNINQIEAKPAKQKRIKNIGTLEDFVGVNNFIVAKYKTMKSDY